MLRKTNNERRTKCSYTPASVQAAALRCHDAQHADDSNMKRIQEPSPAVSQCPSVSSASRALPPSILLRSSRGRTSILGARPFGALAMRADAPRLLQGSPALWWGTTATLRSTLDTRPYSQGSLAPGVAVDRACFARAICSL